MWKDPRASERRDVLKRQQNLPSHELHSEPQVRPRVRPDLPFNNAGSPLIHLDHFKWRNRVIKTSHGNFFQLTSRSPSLPPWHVIYPLPRPLRGRCPGNNVCGNVKPCLRLQDSRVVLLSVRFSLSSVWRPDVFNPRFKLNEVPFGSVIGLNWGYVREVAWICQFFA